MATNRALVPTGEVVSILSLTELCHVSNASADWVIELVEEGILEPVGPNRSAWRFESTCVTTLRRVRRLQADLRLNLAGVAVVLILADENAQLKRRLAQIETEMPDD
jgi:chaperone modulatory protein CbpM